jgi:hypothetical protein
MRLLSLFALVLASVAAMLPPAPPKRHKTVQPPKQGSAAEKLIAKAVKPKAVVLPDYNRLLSWNWQESPGNSWTNTVFIVKSSPNLKDWKPVAWTPTNHWLFYIDLGNPALFFRVTSTNTVTHLVSE